MRTEIEVTRRFILTKTFSLQGTKYFLLRESETALYGEPDSVSKTSLWIVYLFEYGMIYSLINLLWRKVYICFFGYFHFQWCPEHLLCFKLCRDIFAQNRFHMEHISQRWWHDSVTESNSILSSWAKVEQKVLCYFRIRSEKFSLSMVFFLFAFQRRSSSKRSFATSDRVPLSRAECSPKPLIKIVSRSGCTFNVHRYPVWEHGNSVVRVVLSLKWI